MLYYTWEAWFHGELCKSHCLTLVMEASMKTTIYTLLLRKFYVSSVGTVGDSDLFFDDLRRKERFGEDNDPASTAVSKFLFQLRLEKGFVLVASFLDVGCFTVPFWIGRSDCTFNAIDGYIRVWIRCPVLVHTVTDGRIDSRWACRSTSIYTRLWSRSLTLHTDLQRTARASWSPVAFIANLGSQIRR